MKKLSRLLALVLASGVCGTLGPGKVFAAKVTNNTTFGNSRALATTLWYPDNLEIIRGVVAFTGGKASGGSGDTWGTADDRFWQRFSESTGFALLGTQLARGEPLRSSVSLRRSATSRSHATRLTAPLTCHNELENHFQQVLGALSLALRAGARMPGPSPSRPMNKSDAPSSLPPIEPCPTVRLAASDLVAVDRCSCGTLRVNLGALTLRITAEGLQAIMQTLGEALIAHAGMRVTTRAPLAVAPLVNSLSAGKATRGQS